MIQFKLWENVKKYILFFSFFGEGVHTHTHAVESLPCSIHFFQITPIVSDLWLFITGWSYLLFLCLNFIHSFTTALNMMPKEDSASSCLTSQLLELSQVT